MLAAKTSFANVSSLQTDALVITGKESVVMRIIGGWVVCDATATQVTFNSKGTGAGTAITSANPFAANGGMMMPSPSIARVGEIPYGYFETIKGQGLTVTTGAGATNVGITIRYIEL